MIAPLNELNGCQAINLAQCITDLKEYSFCDPDLCGRPRTGKKDHGLRVVLITSVDQCLDKSRVQK
jgi:hypothetical protein